MKRISLLLFVWLVLSADMINAQPAAKTLKKVLELKIPREGGANGASVTWHPGLKRYYAVMAGNVSFSLGVFDAAGKRLSTPEQKTYFDIRGLWYNPNTKTLQMNGYDDFGWAEYKLNSKGFPDTIIVLHKDMNQPDEQSAGAFNPKEKTVYFLNDEGHIDIYDLEGGEFQESFELALGKTKKEADEDDEEITDNDDVIEDYNSSTVIYTGIAGAEIGLLNHVNREIELYNMKDGRLARKFSFPDNAPVPDFLNFSYCNGVYWLFDKETRIWNGYK
jgi:hypothetical protein